VIVFSKGISLAKAYRLVGIDRKISDLRPAIQTGIQTSIQT
jgi:hypothetical protein